MKNINFKSRRAHERRRTSTPSIFQLMTEAQSREARQIARQSALAIIG